MNQEVSITSQLSPILYLWGSALTLDRSVAEAHHLKAQVLMRSSDESWTISSQQIDSLSPKLRPRSGDPRGPFPLAVLLEGTFPDPFPSARSSPLTPAPGKLFVIGAVTPFQEQLIKNGGHAHLLLNAIDALTLGEDLIRIRAKEPMDRSIGSVSSGAKAWWRFFVSLLVPLGIACAGWARLLWRKRAKQQYLQLVLSAS